LSLVQEIYDVSDAIVKTRAIRLSITLQRRTRSIASFAAR